VTRMDETRIAKKSFARKPERRNKGLTPTSRPREASGREKGVSSRGVGVGVGGRLRPVAYGRIV
jgi:hypothetical protein